MKSQRKRISRIVDELISYLFSMGATDISVNIQEREEDFKVLIKGNCKEVESKKFDKLKKALETPKQEEVEEYYWELAGNADGGTELSLVGMMIDKAELDWNAGQLDITLYRSKV